MSETADVGLIEMTSDIVSAFVTNNNVSAGELPALIETTYKALKDAASSAVAEPAPVALTPAVPIKKSVTPDFIISLEDGKKYKSLKRHLSTHGMTPDEYRAKWGLSKDYPMVAASYSAQRSSLAKTLGLGRKAAPEPAPTPAPKKGRGKAAASA